MKRCPQCKETKPIDKFYKDHSKKNGLGSYCKDCNLERNRKWRNDNSEIHNERSRKWREKNPGKKMDSRLQYTYGITLSDYNRMLSYQKDVCKLRHQKCSKQLAVDHCHETGKVRGLLCSKCNQALGLFNDNPNLLARAITYLT